MSEEPMKVDEIMDEDEDEDENKLNSEVVEIIENDSNLQELSDDEGDEKEEEEHDEEFGYTSSSEHVDNSLITITYHKGKTMKVHLYCRKVKLLVCYNNKLCSTCIVS